MALRLTKREWDLLALLERNLTDRQIAEQLSIKLQSAKNAVCSLRKKLHAPSRLAIAKLAKKRMFR